jgi:Fe-S-cluster-containing hydrogenase component 2
MKRLFADSPKCSGCRSCLAACSLNLFTENNPKKAALSIIPHFPDPGVFEVKVCTQCGECAAVCPVSAIKINDRGAYYVDFAECIMCEACVPACPENVMMINAKIFTSTWKCDLCGDCVKVCGTDVLTKSEVA